MCLINIDVDEDYTEMLFKVIIPVAVQFFYSLIHIFDHTFHCFAKKCDTSKNGYLSGEELKHFYDLLTDRQEIDVIYGEYAKTMGYMNPDNLVEFLMKEQREKASLADAHRIIDSWEPDETGWDIAASAPGSTIYLMYFVSTVSS